MLAGAVNQEIARDPLQKRGGVQQAPRLPATDRTQEDLLNEIRCCIPSSAPLEIPEQSRPLADKSVFEPDITGKFAFERRPEYGYGAVVAAGRDRERRTFDRKWWNARRRHRRFQVGNTKGAGTDRPHRLPALCRRLAANLTPLPGTAACPLRTGALDAWRISPRCEGQNVRGAG